MCEQVWLSLLGKCLAFSCILDTYLVEIVNPIIFLWIFLTYTEHDCTNTLWWLSTVSVWLHREIFMAWKKQAITTKLFLCMNLFVLYPLQQTGTHWDARSTSSKFWANTLYVLGAMPLDFLLDTVYLIIYHCAERSYTLHEDWNIFLKIRHYKAEVSIKNQLLHNWSLFTTACPYKIRQSYLEKPATLYASLQ